MLTFSFDFESGKDPGRMEYRGLKIHGKSLFQEIRKDLSIEPCEPELFAKRVKFRDFNGDGWPDLLVWTGNSKHGSMIYSLWIFDPAQKRFITRPELVDLAGPDVGPQGYFSTHFNGGNLTGQSDTFRWIAGEFVLVKTLSTKWDENGNQVKITRILNHGKWTEQCVTAAGSAR